MDANPLKESQPSSLVKTVALKILGSLMSELNHPDTQLHIRKNVVHPIMHMLYMELFPYIVILFCFLVLIFLTSGMTFMFFVLSHRK